MNHSTPILSGKAIRSYEALDARLRAWALAEGGSERQYPALMDAATLRKAEYPEAFPHLLMAASTAPEPDTGFDPLHLKASDWFLSPAVCYHAFAEFGGRTIENEVVLTARGCCFRNEARDELTPGKRQVEFQMRELIFIAPEARIEERLAACQSAVAALAKAEGIEATWCPANDPFFLPRSRGKAVMQRLRGAKLELCLPCGLAIASINRHGTILAERFCISLPDGSPAHTACVAFGLDRWAARLMSSSENGGTADRLRRCLPRTLRSIGEETQLSGLALDSMDTVEFLCAIHAEFGIRLSEVEFSPDQTLGGLIAIIETKLHSS